MALNPYLAAELDYTTYRYPDRFRKFFGEHSNNADPMISGFGVVFFTYLPSVLNSNQNKQILTALCTNTQFPGMTVNVEEYAGRDGGRWRVPTTIAMSGQDITLHFWELVGIPVYRLIASWITLLRNPQYGYMTEINWRQSEYKGKLMYCACTPDMKVQYAKVYGGIMPTNLSDNSFDSNIENQAKVEYDVTFSFDHYPYSSTEITSQAQNMVDLMLSESDTVIRTKYTDAAAMS